MMGHTSHNSFWPIIHSPFTHTHIDSHLYSFIFILKFLTHSYILISYTCMKCVYVYLQFQKYQKKMYVQYVGCMSSLAHEFADGRCQAAFCQSSGLYPGFAPRRSSIVPYQRQYQAIFNGIARMVPVVILGWHSNQYYMI